MRNVRTATVLFRSDIGLLSALNQMYRGQTCSGAVCDALKITK